MALLEIFNTSLIQIIAGVGYLIGNFLLSRKKIFGWLVKIVGGIAWVVFLGVCRQLISHKTIKKAADRPQKHAYFTMELLLILC